MSKQPLFSPKLKEAAEEIKAILNKHDIAGTVFLYDTGFGEYINHIETTKSVISIEEDPDSDGNGFGIRFRTLLEDFNGDQKAQIESTEYSIGMLKIFMEMMAHTFNMYQGVYDAAANCLKIEHSKTVHTSHKVNIEHTFSPE